MNILARRLIKMTFVPKSTPLGPDDHPRTRSLLLILFLAVGSFLILLSTAQTRFRSKTEGLSLFGAGILAVLSAAVLWKSPQFRMPASRQRLAKGSLAVAALLWFLWAALVAYVHRVVEWDEGSYVLSGLALRGYHVPYAAWRAPLTGFLCAAFIGWERFLNPLLLGVLLITVYLWVRRLLGPLPAALSLLTLICQNLLVESSVAIMSELPAAVLLLLGFYCLAKERLWLSALCFTLVVFTRWNLAPVWVVVFLAVLIRFGTRQALKFLCVGLAIFSAWYAITDAMRPYIYIDWPSAGDPLQIVYEGNFQPALTWSANPKETPDFLLRVNFYLKHFFFLTPLALFALIASPVQYLRKHLCTELWVVFVVLPAALLTYLVTMLFMGGLFPRFMTPLIPSAVVCMLCWLFKLTDTFSLFDVQRLGVLTVVIFLTCAVGMWPMSAVGQLRTEQKTPPVFSVELRKKLIALDRAVPLCGIPLEPLSRNHANPAMAEARHLIVFPSAHRDAHDGIIEQPESIESVQRLAGACHPGDLMLVPAKFASGFQAAAVLASDEQWALISNR